MKIVCGSEDDKILAYDFILCTKNQSALFMLTINVFCMEFQESIAYKYTKVRRGFLMQREGKPAFSWINKRVGPAPRS